jgi:hypothetical protein
VRRAATSIFDETRPLAPLPPGGRAQQSFVLSAAQSPATYQAELTVAAAGRTLATCTADFAITPASNGIGLDGTLTLSPDVVDAGDPSDAAYTVRNSGNVSLTDLAIRVVLLDPDTGSVLAELRDTATLLPGQSFTNTQALSTTGLATNRSYLAVLLATPSGEQTERTLDSATLTVVNAPPVCAAALASPPRIWPPNHHLVDVRPVGVTDPDGDPVTITIEAVFQDERTDLQGSGNTCPDATGVGTSVARVLAERSGQQDGRVYHLFFTAADDRGASCQGQVTVCVPHDNHGACVDQGALFDSTVCD